MKKIIKSLIVILPIILFLLIAFLIQVEILTNFESWAYYESVEHMSPLVTNIMKFITHMGDSITVIVICLSLFFIPKLWKNYAIPVSISVIVSAILNITLKNIFARQRPDILRLINETDYSFPSGHAMINMALYSMIALLVCKNIKDKKLKIMTIIFCSGITFLIGISRVYLGVHYITDILAGWCIGFIISLAIYYFWNKKILKT